MKKGISRRSLFLILKAIRFFLGGNTPHIIRFDDPAGGLCAQAVV
jgi:hypothetical protein